MPFLVAENTMGRGGGNMGRGGPVQHNSYPPRNARRSRGRSRPFGRF